MNVSVFLINLLNSLLNPLLTIRNAMFNPTLATPQEMLAFANRLPFWEVLSIEQMAGIAIGFILMPLILAVLFRRHLQSHFWYAFIPIFNYYWLVRVLCGRKWGWCGIVYALIRLSMFQSITPLPANTLNFIMFSAAAIFYYFIGMQLSESLLKKESIGWSLMIGAFPHLALILFMLVHRHEKLPAPKTAAKLKKKPLRRCFLRHFDKSNKPVIKPANKSMTKPTAKPTVKPTDKPAVKPANKPADKPLVEQTANAS